MADIQPTLDLIDGALDDYLSADAMRWTPDEDQRAESNPGTYASGGYLTPGMFRHAVRRMAHERPGLAANPVASVPPRPSTEDVLDNVRRASRWIQEQTEIRLTPWQEDVLRRTYMGPVSIGFESEPMRYGYDRMLFRATLYGWGAPARPGDLLAWGDNHYIVIDEVSRKQRERGAGYTAARDNPRITALHKAYRSRQIARRRRNR